ncbi:RNA-directed DNA polymerase, eukaryota, reverse transcriptase zinc-binding domain protein [Tanacetum coccineum]
MSTERRSKRKIRVPIKYNDIVCDLTKKMISKDDEGINNDMSEAEKVGDDGMVVNGDNDESVRQDFNVYDSDFPFLSKNINLDKEDCRNKDLNEENMNEVYCNDSECNKCITDHRKETICNTQVDKDCNSNTGMINNLNCHINASSNTITDNDTVQPNGEIINKTFADLVKTNEDNADNKLSQIPMTVEDGREVNGMFLFKFKEIEGLNYVLENGPWMVSNKPLMVQRWDPSIVMDKKDTETLPCWIKLYNVPLEAWTVKGISAIASGLGKPVIMDKTTARLCKEETGNFGYARVLVEISAKKEFKEGIKICYKSRDMMNLCSKVVKVEYSWKPPKCSLGKVFGHSDSMCGVKQGSQSTEDGKGGGQKVSQVTKLPSTRMEFRPVQRKTNDNNPRQETPQKEKCNDKSMESNNEKSPQSVGSKSSWKVNKEVLKDIRRSANKFAIFEEITDSEVLEIQLQNKKYIVNKFVRNHRQPTLEDSKNWSKEMFKQFKEQWDNLWKSECLDEDDVFDDGNGSAESIVDIELKGKAKDLLYKGSPIASCEKGYRIIVGWNEEDVNVMLIHSCSQAILCLNVSLNTEDHSEGGSCKTNDMSYFQECIEHIEVEDLNCSGIYFTWVQSRQDPSSGIIKKIDRVLGNVNFMSIFINLHAIFLPRLTSDHSPTLLVIPKVKKRKSKAFRFSNFITNKSEFLSVVQDNYGNLHEKVIELREKLSEIQKSMDKDPHNASIKKQEAMILKEYTIAKKDEEKLLVELVKARLRLSAMRMGKDLKLNSETVSKEDVEFMIRSVSDEEVKDALFDNCDNKAPRPDGYTAKFYKKAWPTVGSDVCNAIKEFFKNRRMLGEVNSTLITLVPKSNTPQRVSDYIPIACCNVLYKIISKILTNRIKKALCKLVNQSQSAFISGRQITDNILLAQEILRGYNRKSGARSGLDVLFV